jgi:hypothetical protein
MQQESCLVVPSAFFSQHAFSSILYDQAWHWGSLLQTAQHSAACQPRHSQSHSQRARRKGHDSYAGTAVQPLPH